MAEEIKHKRSWRRKTAVVEPVADAVVCEVPAEPSTPMLTQDELFKIQLYHSEVARATAEAETARMRKKWILALLDPKGTVEAEEKRMEKWQKEAKVFYHKYEAIKARASSRLKVDLSQCGFDAETGVVHVPHSAKGKD